MKKSTVHLGVVSPPPKGDQSNCKRKAKPRSGGAGKDMLWPEMIGKKFRKYGQEESIAVHLQNMPIYYVNYKKEEDGVNALIELIHKKRVVATEERNINLSKGYGTLLQRGRKTPRWLLCTFKDRKKIILNARYI